MSENTSATGGFLSQVGPGPVEGAALDAVLQKIVVGICALPGPLVRPRWQPAPPQQPALTVDWCAIGVADDEPDATPYQRHIGSANEGLGQTILLRHEVLNVLASFYGPNSYSFAKQLRDGLYVGQNRETLQAMDAGLVGCGTIKRVPALINETWQLRADLPFQIRRQIKRTYQIQNIIAAEGEFIAEEQTRVYREPFTVEEPTT
jgi:hypothetical protein